MTLDELVKDIDIQEVREKNLNSERLNSIYSDVENAKKIIKWGAIIGGSICFILLIFVICLIFIFVYWLAYVLVPRGKKTMRKASWLHL